MNIFRNYFIASINYKFLIGNLNVIETIDGMYKINNLDGFYRKRLLYNCGWGQEIGFELMPPLAFNELIELVIRHGELCDGFSKADSFSNCIGSIAVIMEDHIEELISFLYSRINTDFFYGKNIKKNFQWFCFDEKKAGFKGGIGTKSYEEILNKYPKWPEISQKVKDLVYNKY